MRSAELHCVLSSKTSGEAFELFQTVSSRAVNFRLNMPGSVGKQSFTETRCWDMSTRKIKIDDENADGTAASAVLHCVLSSMTSGEAFELFKTVEDSTEENHGDH